MSAKRRYARRDRRLRQWARRELKRVAGLADNQPGWPRAWARMVRSGQLLIPFAGVRVPRSLRYVYGFAVSTDA